MQEIVFASKNKGKIKELKSILEPLNIKVLSLKDLNIDIDIIEDKDTFKGNALKKANEIMQLTNKPTLADDSGLCVKALNNKPGVYSHRYIGSDNHLGNLKLLSEMFYEKDRSAYLKTVLCLCIPNKKPIFTEGILNGIITSEENGQCGFGFDSIFLIENKQKTLAQLSIEEKNGISHRGQAINKMLEKIKKEVI